MVWKKAKLLSAMGALDSVVEKVEAHIMMTDDESDIRGVDTEIEMTLDSDCCEHVMDLRMLQAMAHL